MPAKGPDHPVLGPGFSLPIRLGPYLVVSPRGGRGLAKVAEHRAIWEHFNGPIPPNHDVHHKNGDKTDNRIENLELVSKSDHMRLHAGWIKRDGEWFKICPGCGRELAMDQFWKRSGRPAFQRRARCKRCEVAAHRAYVSAKATA